MARVSTYLNFPGNTESAFLFYREVFGSDFIGHVARFSDAPPNPDHPLSEQEAQKILHIELPILGGHVLMGTDIPESMGGRVMHGNTIHINLETDTREETERLYRALSAGGQVMMPLQDMFWGAYFASFTDRFGINWMINCAQNPAA